MATEVTVKIRDSTLGQALLVKQEEWDLCLCDIRGILLAQDVETPSEYRFITGNGNVVSTTLETTMTFRDVVGSEPFAEIKKEDTSLHSAERRVSPQIMIMPAGESSRNPPTEGTENQCPFIVKFPLFAGAMGTLPCMRNVLNVHTLLKVAFLLTCLLFLMIFVLTLGLHLLFGIGAVGGFAGGHGFLGGMQVYPHQQTTGFADQEALTSLKVKLSEMEVAHRFEIQDLKQKLAELEDMQLTQFKEMEAIKKDLAIATANESAPEKQYALEMENLMARLSKVEDSMVERWRPQHEDFTRDSEAEEVVEDTKVAEETEKEIIAEEEGATEAGKDSNMEEKAAKEKKNKEDKKKNKKEKGKKKDKKNKKRN